MNFQMTDRNKQQNNKWHNAAILLIVAISIIWIVSDQLKKEAYYEPNYKKENLEPFFEDGSISEKEYELLFKQTGLGKSAIDSIVSNEKNYIKKINEFQDIFFDVDTYTCGKIGIVTFQERYRDSRGKLIREYQLVDLQPGDILITFSTYTLGYRHGHCGIVVDTKENKTVEAVLLGKPTAYRNLGKWEACPTLLHLRISEKAANKKGYEQEELGALLAEYTVSNGLDVSYGLLSGVFGETGTTMKQTHCSHLIWYVFNSYGYDINSDGGRIVTPMDIAQSDLLEIVQIYGIDSTRINRR